MTRLALAILLIPAPALAGKCDAQLARISTSEGAALVESYGTLLRCDAEVAGTAFGTVVKQVKDLDTAVGVALTAIDHKAYAPVWSMLEVVPDYEMRDQIAKGVGAACVDHPEVVTFLQGAYFGLRNTQFGRWSPALGECAAPTLQSWLEETASKPPAVIYDEKYNSILTALVARQGVEALPVLQRAAVEAAGKGGPFSAIIEKMTEAIQPKELGASPTPESKQKLEQAFVAVANAVAPEQAAMVADRLYNSGAEASAATLLPRIYPDRVQADGGLLYGVASIEACGGQAVVHYATVNEPAKRWSILSDIEGPARAFKPRLKCPAGDPWPVFVTPEPIASATDLETWSATVVTQAGAKGDTVKTRPEKGLRLD